MRLRAQVLDETLDRSVEAPPRRDVRLLHPAVHERQVVVALQGPQRDRRHGPARSGLGIVT